MIKFRFYLDKDAETEWLNGMADQGYAMTGFCAGFYRFDSCEPGEYRYQVDFGDRFFGVTEDYREFMQDTGAEIVQTWGYWVILRRLAEKGEFVLYTDVDSSIEHYTKIRKMFKVVTVFELICFFIEVFGAVSGNRLAVAFAFQLGAILLALVSQVFKMNAIIAKLRERKGEAVSGKYGPLSALVPCGLLLNSCALILEETIHPTAKMATQIAAIILMLVGVYRTARYRGKYRSKDE